MVFALKNLNYELGSYMTAQGVNTNGRRDACGEFEINLAECLEAYGVAEGQYRCKKYSDDAHECRAGTMSQYRNYLMHVERAKKLATGKLPLSQRYGTPYPWDAFVDGSFVP